MCSTISENKFCTPNLGYVPEYFNHKYFGDMLCTPQNKKSSLLSTQNKKNQVYYQHETKKNQQRRLFTLPLPGNFSAMFLTSSLAIPRMNKFRTLIKYVTHI